MTNDITLQDDWSIIHNRKFTKKRLLIMSKELDRKIMQYTKEVGYSSASEMIRAALIYFFKMHKMEDK